MQLLFSWQCVSNDPLAANNSELFLDPKLAGNYTGNDGDWTRPAGCANRQVEYVCGKAGNSGTFFEEGEYLKNGEYDPMPPPDVSLSAI